jgi:hypothetical protein
VHLSDRPVYTIPQDSQLQGGGKILPDDLDPVDQIKYQQMSHVVTHTNIYQIDMFRNIKNFALH